jgi:hypothetical protein
MNYHKEIQNHCDDCTKTNILLEMICLNIDIYGIIKSGD